MNQRILIKAIAHSFHRPVRVRHPGQKKNINAVLGVCLNGKSLTRRKFSINLSGLLNYEIV